MGHHDGVPARALIKAMLAVPGELPTGPGADAWAFEMKWDGIRAVVYAEDGVDGGVVAMSRNDRDITATYPELAGVRASLGGLRAVLDGELVALDHAGRPSFGTLQQRMNIADPQAAIRLAEQIPVAYVVFDLLRLEGQSLLRQPYAARRELLERLELSGHSCLTAPVFHGSGEQIWQASIEQGMEGLVAKRVDSTYDPGRRSPSWRKIKRVRDVEVVIGGWRPGAGRRAGTIGSLMLGVPEHAPEHAPEHGRSRSQTPSPLRYVGQVGTGFTDAMLSQLGRQLAPLRRTTSPFTNPLPAAIAAGAHWVEPVVVGEVTFAQWTADGVLRHPSWRGVRPDKSPADVAATPPAGH
jgi:bifunctional non-homologous end joining protein LigD